MEISILMLIVFVSLICAFEETQETTSFSTSSTTTVNVKKYSDEWTTFKHKFSKNYRNRSHENQSMLKWIGRKEFIRTHNKKFNSSQVTYNCTEYPFMDLVNFILVMS